MRHAHRWAKWCAWRTLRLSGQSRIKLAAANTPPAKSMPCGQAPQAQLGHKVLMRCALVCNAWVIAPLWGIWAWRVVMLQQKPCVLL
ncbi:MAG: hypothetical protein B7Y58_09930 [Halothiobacillus sp. 35-54-62]|nr:MAG: hypothetical protein B7Y58_09930 [Halothiobacillus sp. 35-54-62]